MKIRFLRLIALVLTAAVLLFASLPEAVWNALRRTLLPETLVGEKTRLKLRRAAGHCATA